MPKYAPGPSYSFINVPGSPGCNYCKNGALKFMYVERSMFSYMHLCTSTLNEFTGKWMTLERKTAVFTLRTFNEERPKLQKVRKYTTKALGLRTFSSLGGTIASA